MGRNLLLGFLLLFLIVSDVSDATSLVLKFRELIGLESAPASAVEPGSPSPSHVPILKQWDPKPTDEVKEGKPDSINTPKDGVKGGKGVIASPPVDTGGNSNDKGMGDNNKKDGLTEEEKTKVNGAGGNNEKDGAAQGSGTGDNKEKDNGRGENKEKNSGISQNKETENGAGDDNKKDVITKENQEKKHETCGQSATTCPDLDKVSACLSISEGSKSSFILVENGGDKSLTAELRVGDVKEWNVAEQKIGKINITSITSESLTLILHSGNASCELQISTLGPEQNFLHFPSYDKLMTPVNGAYFFILTVFILGGTWACCKLRKRSRHDGVRYQELEMGLPQSASAIDVETAEGWDDGWNEDWDDDWNEDNAVKSPGARHVGSISANGLTSRSSNRGGWENDWDE